MVSVRAERRQACKQVQIVCGRFALLLLLMSFVWLVWCRTAATGSVLCRLQLVSYRPCKLVHRCRRKRGLHDVAAKGHLFAPAVSKEGSEGVSTSKPDIKALSLMRFNLG
jgi:hypothetical protein